MPYSYNNACNIGIVYNLRADYEGTGLKEEELAEFDSESTIEAIDSALSRLGYKTERIGNGIELCRRLVSGSRWDLVFNIAEGLKGRCRESQVPAILELYDIPYTFSDPFVCALTLDKNAAKKIVRAEGIRTAESFLVRNLSDIKRVTLPYPLFVKPVAEGTGKGIDSNSRAASESEFEASVKNLLLRYNQPVLVEQYLPGREFTTAVLGNGESPRVIGTFEVKFRKNAPHNDYTFEMKELCEDYIDYSLLSDGPLRDQVELLAMNSYIALECRDAGRVDIRLDGDGLASFMEINPLPGLHPTHSDLPMIATAVGISYDELIKNIVEAALERIKKQ